MNQNKKIDNKKIIFIVVGIIVLVVIGLCFIKALNNTKTSSKTSNNQNSSASEISEEYDNKDYGESTDLDGTSITSGGSYNITGENSCITINTTKDVELNISDASISCTSGPAINVEDAGTVSIVLSGKNKITSTTTTDLDGAIYSKADLVFSGDGSLEITSNYDGIVSKDTLVFKSGTYVISSDDDGIRGKDNVAIVDGTFTINSKGDGIKSTNEEDTSKGYIAIDGGIFNITSVTDAIQAQTDLNINGGTFVIKTSGNTSTYSAKGLKGVNSIEINGGIFNINTTDDGIHSDGDITLNDGTFNITSKDDAIHADGKVEINGGIYEISAAEGIEATYVKINDGDINISASDDGVNAGNKSNKYSVTVEINGGNITIKMGQGDTDGIDSNGNIYIYGGTINITAQSPFDYDGEAKKTGGTIIVNGEETNTITNQMMGGGDPMNQGNGMNRRFNRR